MVYWYILCNVNNVNNKLYYIESNIYDFDLIKLIYKV